MSWRYYKDELWDHTIKRINQAKIKSAGDEQKFNNMMLLRARRCGEEKIDMFVEALKHEGYTELAGQVEVVKLGWLLSKQLAN